MLISGISSMATRALLAELADAYGSRSAVRVAIESVGGVDAAKRVRAGEPFDVVVLASGVVAALEAEGHVVAGSRVDFARSPMAMAVPAGRPKPDVSGEDGVKAAMLGAGRIGFSTGPSGDQLQRLWQKWGIAEELAGRLVQARPGIPVGTLVASGEADVGFQQLSELMGVGGIDVVGCLPSELDTDTVFSAGIAVSCRQGDAARALLAFLASPDAAASKRRQGMEPA